MLRETYWQTYSAALRVANRHARNTGVRHRVQRCTWPAGTVLGVPARWYVSPTPAPAPEVAEPCSMATEDEQGAA